MMNTRLFSLSLMLLGAVSGFSQSDQFKFTPKDSVQQLEYDEFLTATKAAFLPFADQRRRFRFNDIELTPSQVKRINAVMQTCGLYDESGDFADRVGLPGKSGVGGGIAAVCPGRYAVATWGPRLNEKGNSVMGLHALEQLTTLTAESIF